MTSPVRVVTCTSDELCTLVRSAVRAELERKTTPNTSELLTTREAASYCSMTPTMLLKHVAHGRLVPDSPSRKGFRVHRFRRATLDAFLVRL